MTDAVTMSKKIRARGNTGPDRKELKTFAQLGTIDPALIARLVDFAKQNHDTDDLLSDRYQISRHCDPKDVFNVTPAMYRQVLLQELDTSLPGDQEQSYGVWSMADPVVEELWAVLSEYFTTIYRARISTMEPNSQLNWHIDTNTSYLCRAQVGLVTEESVFQFKRHGIQEDLIMKPGELWFINTGWPHRVVTGNQTRLSLIFSFTFDALLKQYQDQTLLGPSIAS